jgi:prophage antirepressor-like protein
MNELALTFESWSVRVATIDGEPWWVLADVCAVLEHSDASMAAARLDADEKGTSIVCTPSGNQEMLIVSEPGLYKLLQTSRKPQAKRFDRWVRHEVLPSIRKTGTYGSPSLTPPIQIQAISDLFDRKLEPVVIEMRTGFKRLDNNVIELIAKGRKNADAETVRAHGKVIRYHFNGNCPCLECDIRIMDDDGFITGVWHHHHQNNRNDNRSTAMIPLAIGCHKRIESDPEARRRFARAFDMFQTLLERLSMKQLSLRFDI